MFRINKPSQQNKQTKKTHDDVGVINKNIEISLGENQYIEFDYCEF